MAYHRSLTKSAFALLTFSTTVFAENCSVPPLSIQAADTFLTRGYANDLRNDERFLNYEHGVVWRALEMVYNNTQNKSYVEHIQKGVDKIVTAEGGLKDYNLTYYTLSDIRIGETLIHLNELTGESKYKSGADLLKSKISTQPRNPLVGFWHRSTYPNQMWLDGLYMLSPFYAHYASSYQSSNTTAYDDIVNQFTLAHDHCVDVTTFETGLLKHGYDSSRSAVWTENTTGASPESWNRALGWYVLALVDVLDYLPASHNGHATLISILNEILTGVVNAIDEESGLWWLVLTQPGRERNYIESSGSAMFVHALFKGVRMGYLDFTTFMAPATSAYKKLVERFLGSNVTDGGLVWEGTVRVGSLSGNRDDDYYISVPLSTNDLKGFRPFVMASVEYENAVC